MELATLLRHKQQLWEREQYQEALRTGFLVSEMRNQRRRKPGDKWWTVDDIVKRPSWMPKQEMSIEEATTSMRVWAATVNKQFSQA